MAITGGHYEMQCSCGKWVYLDYKLLEYGWTAQHGENPEHRTSIPEVIERDSQPAIRRLVEWVMKVHEFEAGKLGFAHSVG